MTRYRIVPHGLTQWRLQGKWLLWWRDRGRFTGYEHWEPFVFDNEADARAYLRLCEELEDEWRQIRDREMSVAPIELTH